MRDHSHRGPGAPDYGEHRRDYLTVTETSEVSTAQSAGPRIMWRADVLRACLITALAGRDQDRSPKREVLTGVLFEPQRTTETAVSNDYGLRLVSSDGRIMIIVDTAITLPYFEPVIYNGDDLEAVSKIRIPKRNRSGTYATIEGDRFSVDYEGGYDKRLRRVNAVFPNYEPLMPDALAEGARYGVNAHYMRLIMDTLIKGCAEVDAAPIARMHPPKADAEGAPAIITWQARDAFVARAAVMPMSVHW